MIKRGTLRGFRTSLGRGDPCTRYQAQSCAQRTTLLSVSYKSGFHFQTFDGLDASEIAAARQNLESRRCASPAIQDSVALCSWRALLFRWPRAARECTREGASACAILAYFDLSSKQDALDGGEA